MPLAGLTESHPAGPLVTLAAAVNGRVPFDAVTATVCVAGAGAPNCERKLREAGETARLCGCPTVRFTLTVCGLLPADEDVMVTVPV